MPVQMPSQQHIEPLRFGEAAQAAAAAVAVQQKLTGTTTTSNNGNNKATKSPVVEVPKHYKPTKNPRALPDRLPTPGHGYAVFVGTLPTDTTTAELEAIGRPFGVLLRPPLLLPKKGRDGLRCGFLTFGGIKAAQNCIEHLNGFAIREGTLPLSVRFSNSSADQVPNLPPKGAQNSPTTPLIKGGKKGSGESCTSSAGSIGHSSFNSASAPPSPPQVHGSQATSSPQPHIPVLPPPPLSAGVPSIAVQQCNSAALQQHQMLMQQNQPMLPPAPVVGDQQGQVLQGLLMQQQQLIAQRQMLLAVQQQQHTTAAASAAAEAALLNKQMEQKKLEDLVAVQMLSPMQPLTPMMSPATPINASPTFDANPLVTPAVSPPVSPPLGSEEDQDEDDVLFIKDEADVPELVDEVADDDDVAPPELDAPDSTPSTPQAHHRDVRDRGSPVPPAFPTVAQRRV